MALIECPECKKAVSSLATSCPECGCPISTADIPKIELEMTLELAKEKQNHYDGILTAIQVSLCVLGSIGSLLAFIRVISWFVLIIFLGVGTVAWFNFSSKKTTIEKYIEKHFGKVIDHRT